MKILAVGTATEACSAALYIDGEIKQEYRLAPREHTKLILQMVNDLLQNADIKISALDALAFGRGPGSFTGVRIATGVVQGLAFSNELPVIPVSTLASIAQRVYDDHQYENVLAGIDARMGEMYWGCYTLSENGLMELQGDEQVTPPESVKLPSIKLPSVNQSDETQTDWAGAGTAWESYSDALNCKQLANITKHYPEYYPSSSTIAKLAVYEFEQGKMVEASQALPVYLRNNVAKKSSKVKLSPAVPK